MKDEYEESIKNNNEPLVSTDTEEEENEENLNDD